MFNGLGFKSPFKRAGSDSVENIKYIITELFKNNPFLY